MKAVCVLVALSLGMCTSEASAQSTWFNLQLDVLDDGLQLVTDTHSHGIASAKIVVYGGAIHEAPQFRGIARVTANTIINPVPTTTTSDGLHNLQARLHRIGATISVEVGLKTSIFSLSAPSTGISEALELLLLNLSSPSLAFARIKSEALVQSRRGLTRSSESLNATLGRYLYTNQGSQILDPTRTSSQTIDANAVRHFYNKYYRPDRIMILATGGLQMVKLRRIVKQSLLLPLPDDHTAFITTTSTTVLAAPILPIKVSGLASPRQVIVGFKGCPAFSDNAPSCFVLGEILRSVAESKLQAQFGASISVDGGYVVLPREGFFALRLRAGKWTGVRALLDEIIKGIGKEITAARIEQAINTFDRRMKWYRAHPRQLADFYMKLLLTGRRDPVDFESFENEIRSASVKNLVELSSSFFTKESEFSIRLTPVLK